MGKDTGKPHPTALFAHINCQASTKHPKGMCLKHKIEEQHKKCNNQEEQMKRATSDSKASTGFRELGGQAGGECCV